MMSIISSTNKVFRIRKEPDTESNNSEMVLNNISVNMEDFIKFLCYLIQIKPSKVKLKIG